MIEYFAYVLVFFISLTGVELYRRWSLRRKFLDIPNERSSHEVPTPRGGGVVFVLVTLVTLGLFSVFKSVNLPWEFFAGALIVSAISLVDDIYGISPFLRLICHGFAAAIIVAGNGGFTDISMPVFGQLHLGASLGGLLAFLWIVWLTNAYNFMDGIDGIAGLQAVIAGLGWCFYGGIAGFENLSFAGGIIAAAVSGFLLLNWQPAKIFMGDVGSAFLGYSFAVIPLIGFRTSGDQTAGANLFVIGILLVWPFVADSIYTFLRRLLRGEKVWKAHREHIYQRMVIVGASHSSVTLLYGCLALLIGGVIVATAYFKIAADMYFLGAAVFAGLFTLVFHKPIARCFAGPSKGEDRR